MKHHLKYTLLSLFLFGCTQPKVIEAVPENECGIVLEKDDALFFRKQGFSGSVVAPRSGKRLITIDNKTYEVSVRRRRPLGGNSIVRAKTGVYDPAESFFPHSNLQIVYDEYVKDYYSRQAMLNDISNGLQKFKNDDFYLLSTTGLRLKISGSFEHGRVSISIVKFKLNGKPVSLPDELQSGKLYLVDKYN